MSDALLTLIEVVLIPAGVLPVVTAIVLRRYRNSDSQSLRDRWHLALALALLGLLTAVIAGLALLGIRIGSVWVAFGLALLIADVVSGKWLIDFWRGRFR